MHYPNRLLLSNLNALVAISKGTWAVKLCANKILQSYSTKCPQLIKAYF